MKATWLGQSGYLFECGGERLLIDPFYSNIVEERQGLKRLMQPPIAIEELRPDLIFITHNHMDHFDPIALPQIHRRYTAVPVLGPQSVLEKGREFEFDEKAMVLFRRGDQHKAKHFTLHGISAYHGDPFALGCLLEAEGQLVYYSGDTEYSDELVEEIKSAAMAIGQTIDIVFIIINGRLGNMNVQAAVHLTSQLQPGLAIPMHYGMFAENTEDPQVFINGCRENNVDAIELIPGETTTI